MADVLIQEGKIAALGDTAARIASTLPHCEVFDASEMLVLPGFVNAHYHSHDVLIRGLPEQMPLDVWALHAFPSFYPRRPAAEVRARTLSGAAECIRSGITTVQDMVTVVGDDREHVQSIVDAYEQIGLRACLGLQVGDRSTIDTMPFWREMLPKELQERYVKSLNPAGMQGLIEWAMKLPSSDRISWALAPSTPERCSDELLTWVKDISEREKLRVFTHLYETRAQAVLARVRQQIDGSSFVQMLDRLGLLNGNLTVVHGIWITSNEIAHLADAGVSLLSNPMANLKLLNGVVPLQQYRDAGVNIGLGTDNCSCSDAHNMFQAMKAFAIFLGFQDGEATESAAAVAYKAATTGSALALGMANKIGSLAAGACADLTLIDLRDSFYHPLNSAVKQVVYAETGRNVRNVMVNGAWVLRDGELASADEHLLFKNADEAGAALREEYLKLANGNRSLMPHLKPIHKHIADFDLPIDRFRLF